MGIKEKIKALQDYCEKRCSCENEFGEEVCPLGNGEECMLDITAPEDKINTLFDSVFHPEPVEKSESTEQTHDVVNHPSHYCQGGMECIDEMILLFGREVVKHFCLCNAWKYRKRAMFKNGQEDMDKSDWYIKKYKELCNCE